MTFSDLQRLSFHCTLKLGATPREELFNLFPANRNRSASNNLRIVCYFSTDCRKGRQYCFRSNRDVLEELTGAPKRPADFKPGRRGMRYDAVRLATRDVPERFDQDRLCSAALNSCGPSGFFMLGFQCGTLDHIHKPGLSLRLHVGVDRR